MKWTAWHIKERERVCVGYVDEKKRKIVEPTVENKQAQANIYTEELQSSETVSSESYLILIL